MIRPKWLGHAPLLRSFQQSARLFSSAVVARAPDQHHQNGDPQWVIPGQTQTDEQTASSENGSGQPSVVEKATTSTASTFPVTASQLATRIPLAPSQSLSNLSKNHSKQRTAAQWPPTAKSSSLLPTNDIPDSEKHAFGQFAQQQPSIFNNSNPVPRINKLSSPTPDSVVHDEFAEFRTSAVAPRIALAKQEEAVRHNLIKSLKKNQGLQAASSEQKHMLTISGLSPHLKAIDFYRLAGKNLADWNLVVNEVSQERDPWTLEPLGVYRISFPSASSALIYQDKLNRLLQLAQHKMRSPNGLWKASIPTQLLTTPDADLDAELAPFALAPGSYCSFDMSRSRVKGKFPWQLLMDNIISGTVYSRGNPGAVLLELNPPSLNIEDLLGFIKKDEIARNGKWQHSRPYSLVQTMRQDQDMLRSGESTRVPLSNDVSFRQKLMSRFVIIFKDETSAWRFVRSWNQRVLMTGTGGHIRRTLVKASLIER